MDYTPIRAPRGNSISCKGWQQEAALRMLMNNLDPDVAERPDDLVVYGGTGKAARSWEAFDAIVDTLRALEQALLDFPGCVVVISHDRWFLDRIATHILAFEGDSHVEWFAGNFQEYEEDKKRRLGADADQPHRIKYRKLMR